MDIKNLKYVMPNEIVVAVREYEKTIGFVVYETKPGAYNKDTSFKNWRRRGDDRRYNNEPLTGFKLADLVGGEGRESRMGKIRVMDPRGFLIELIPNDVIDLINKVGYSSEIGINSPCSYVWKDNTLQLAPITKDEYYNYFKEKESTETYKINKLIPGHYYKCKNSYHCGYYLGKFAYPDSPKFSQIGTLMEGNIKYRINACHPTHAMKHVIMLDKNGGFNLFKSSTYEYMEDTTKPVLTPDEISMYVKTYIKSYVEYNGNIVPKIPTKFEKFFVPEKFYIDTKFNRMFFKGDRTLKDSFTSAGHLLISNDNKVIMLLYTDWHKKLYIDKMFTIINGTVTEIDYTDEYKTYNYRITDIDLTKGYNDTTVQNFFKNFEHFKLIDKSRSNIYVVDSNNNAFLTELKLY